MATACPHHLTLWRYYPSPNYPIGDDARHPYATEAHPYTIQCKRVHTPGHTVHRNGKRTWTTGGKPCRACGQPRHIGKRQGCSRCKHRHGRGGMLGGLTTRYRKH